MEQNTRMEKDTMGTIAVPADRYWGAQTQRSLNNFKIGTERMPIEVIRAFGALKKAAALANLKLGVLDERRAMLIANVCDEITSGALDAHFPLVVWQTGSGTQTNMNVNEVIANRGNELAGEALLHPNDHVNRSQSSNDTFPTAMHIAACQETKALLLPALDLLYGTLDGLSQAYQDIIKVGRTHLQDATPMTLGQEIGGWAGMLSACRDMIQSALMPLSFLALGGTAVGTGLNAPLGFDQEAAAVLSRETGIAFAPASNKFHALSSKDAMVFAHGALKTLAADLMKLACDVRLLSSGPRCGIGELLIPANEPGSSIMPGKVNPTQCEAVTMVAAQVMGNDVTVGMAAGMGILELNVYMPVCIYNYLQSVRLLADGMHSFNDHCIAGLTPDRAVIQGYLDRSLMTVTALSPLIGYEKAAKIAKLAHEENLTLKEASRRLGFLSDEAFDSAMNPANMVFPAEKRNA
ncbi:MAG: class II fumarate hydratase [Clostridia bacterium]|nr:class II fumarate hydratase [Clostridia bacterium]